MIERIKPTSNIGTPKKRNTQNINSSPQTPAKLQRKMAGGIDTKIIEVIPTTDEVAVNSVAFVFASKESSWTA